MKKKVWPKRIWTDDRWRPLGRSAVERQLSLNWNSYFDRPKWKPRWYGPPPQEREHQYLTFVVYAGMYPKFAMGREAAAFYAPSSLGIFLRPIKGVHSHGRTRKHQFKQWKRKAVW